MNWTWNNNIFKQTIASKWSDADGNGKETEGKNVQYFTHLVANTRNYITTSTKDENAQAHTKTNTNTSKTTT